jgi:opacity protein-like surface antigen
MPVVATRQHNRRGGRTDDKRGAVMRKFFPLMALAVTLGAGVAQAGNGLFYVGAGISRDKLSNVSSNGFGLRDLDNTSYKVLAGFRPISLFALEANYLDLGSQTTNFVDVSAHTNYHAFAAYAVGFLPVPMPYLDLFGKAGLARWNSSGTSTVFPSGSLFSLSDNGTSFAWGAGAQIHVGNIGGRLEYENVNIPHTNGAQIISLSVILSLL